MLYRVVGYNKYCDTYDVVEDVLVQERRNGSYSYPEPHVVEAKTSGVLSIGKTYSGVPMNEYIQGRFCRVGFNQDVDPIC